MLKHIIFSDCSRCKNIPPYTYVNFFGADALSPELESLVGDTRGVDMYQRVTQCPECGTYYMNINECGFMENDMEVRRISPVEAGETLSPEDLIWFQEQLKHPNPLVRAYAEETFRNLNKTS